MLLVFVASDEEGTVQGPVGCVRVEGSVPEWGQSKQFDARRLDMDEDDAAELVEMIKNGDASVAKSVRYVHVEASAAESLGFAAGKKKKKASKAPTKSIINKADAKKGKAKSGKGKAKDEKDKVKRAPTGYQLFGNEKRAECVEELKAEATPEEPFKQQQTMKRLAEKWNALTEEERKGYKDEAARKATAEAEKALFGEQETKEEETKEEESKEEE